MREAKKKGSLANFGKGNFVLIARENFSEGEKLCPRRRRPGRITMDHSEYVGRVEDLPYGTQDDIHATRLELYCDKTLDEKTIFSLVLASETGMEVSRLLRLVEEDGSLRILVL